MSLINKELADFDQKRFCIIQLFYGNWGISNPKREIRQARTRRSANKELSPCYLLGKMNLPYLDM